MKSLKVITITFPEEKGKELQKIADDEKISVSDLILKSIKLYEAKKVIKSLAKKKGLKPKDFTRKKRVLKAVKIKTKGFKFNRDEANAR